MTLEECRVAMLAHHEKLIEDAALRVAGMVYPKLPLDVALSIVEPMIRKAIYDALPEETKFFLKPTTCQVS